MKLIIAIAHDRDRHHLADALTENGFAFTKLGSTGGFLRQGNVTVMVGVEDADVGRALDIIKAACGASERYVNVPGQLASGSGTSLGVQPPHPIKVETGGAVAFVVAVEDFQRF